MKALLRQWTISAIYCKDGIGKQPDYEEALKYFKLAADKECSEAINYLGIMYQKGLGVEANPKKASLYLEKAAELGFEPPKNEEEKEVVVNNDEPQTKNYFKLATENFDLFAQFIYNKCYS